MKNHTGPPEPETRLVVHTKWGLVIFESTDSDEIAAAIEAVAVLEGR